MPITPSMPFIQLIVALVFGMILGVERVLAGQTAGPRTYGLVSIGSCLATILSVDISASYVSTANPLPIFGAILTGVGFIGAGLIVLHGSRLSGLTTAAGIWVAAIIGIAVGFRAFTLATFTTFLTLFVFSIMWRIEWYIKKKFASDFWPTDEHNGNDNGSEPK